MVQPITYIDVTVGSDPGTASSGATTAGTLSAAIAQLNASDPAGGPYVIRLDTDVSLSGPLSPILGSVTIEGNGHTIDAGGATRIFFVGTDLATMTTPQGNPPSTTSIISQRQQVTIADVTLTGGTAKGGNGGDGGGGGLGAGGALFVNQSADVTLSNVGFSSDSAVGGGGTTTFGASHPGGGGGGLGGAGGAFQGGGGGGIFGSGHIGGGVFGDSFGASGAGFSSAYGSTTNYGENGMLPIYGLGGGGGYAQSPRQDYSGGTVGGSGGNGAYGGSGGFGG